MHHLFISGSVPDIKLGQPEHGNMPQETNLLLRLTLMTNTDGPSRDWPYVFSASFAAHLNLNTFKIGIFP